ncbi:MAG: acetolactate synthase small subunit [Spirochaetes bacterium]|nr:MAG: acetolactate synthase small subunit [Spirochaetota bacterium]
MTHTVSLLVENHEGVLSRIARLFDGRGYRLMSLTTSATAEDTENRITLVVSGAHNALEKVEKQLEKFIDVIHLEVRSDPAGS